LGEGGTVRRLDALFGRGDIAGVPEMLTEDVEWAEALDG
jgi:ketosteroid isomerase-like protein